MLDERVAAVIADGRISHALLLTGDEEQLFGQAIELARALLCQNPAEGQPCGKCAACEKIADGNHPDLRIIEPDGAAIKIHQIRAAQHFLNLATYEGGRQVVILNGAHTMQAPAANSLLKSLEEPPKGCYFILTAPVADTLLPTIISRVVRYRIEGGDTPEVKVKEAELKSEMREKAAEVISALDRDISYLLRLVSGFKEDKKRGFTAKKQATVFLEQMLQLWRDELITAVKGRGRFAAAAALKSARLVEEYIGLIRGNVNVSLLMTVLVIKLQDFQQNPS